jgi:hypothetical protein
MCRFVLSVIYPRVSASSAVSFVPEARLGVGGFLAAQTLQWPNLATERINWCLFLTRRIQHVFKSATLIYDNSVIFVRVRTFF